MLASIGRWCFRRRWWVLAAWLAAVTAGVLAAGTVFGGLATNSAESGIEAAEAYDQISGGNDEGPEVVALVDRVDPGSPTVRAVVIASAEAISSRADVLTVAQPYSGDQQATAMLGNDGRSLLVSVRLRAGVEDATLSGVADRLHRIADDLRSAGEAGARVRVGGNRLLNERPTSRCAPTWSGPN